MYNVISMKNKLESLKSDAFYKNYFKKFRKDDLVYMKEFLLELETMTPDEKRLAVYRSATRSNKPKNWTAIEELLSIIIKGNNHDD